MSGEFAVWMGHVERPARGFNFNPFAIVQRFGTKETLGEAIETAKKGGGHCWVEKTGEVAHIEDQAPISLAGH